MPITEPVDEEELEDELEAMEQENLDKELLKTGTVPVNDRVGALPQAANGPSTYHNPLLPSLPDLPLNTQKEHCLLALKLSKIERLRIPSTS